MVTQTARCGPLVRKLRRLVLGALLLTAFIGGSSRFALAQPSSEQRSSRTLTGQDLPSLHPRGEPSPLEGRPLRNLVLREGGESRDEALSLQFIAPGDLLNAELVRRAMRELLESGKYASVSAEVEAYGDGVRLRLVVQQRKIVADVRISGGVLDAETSLRVAELSVGQETTRADLSKIAARLWQHYRLSGYPQAQVSGRWLETDEANRVIVVLDVSPGPAVTVGVRSFEVTQKALPQLLQWLETYDVAVGDRADSEALNDADEALMLRLQRAGWHRAKVSHHLKENAGSSRSTALPLVVLVDPGNWVRVHFEGNHAFDEVALHDALKLDEENERGTDKLVARVVSFYRERGYADVSVTPKEVPHGAITELWLSIRERERLRVVGREFPCLSGSRDAEQLNEELNGFINEAMPGGDELLGVVDSAELDRSTAPSLSRGAGPQQAPLTPAHYYEQDIYERALEHVHDLYRSEGYLSASVGPVTLLRRRCHPLSQPGQCLPLGERATLAPNCPTSIQPIPTDEPLDQSGTCQPDALHGRFCESYVVLGIPVKLGPRTTLWDIEFVGNERHTESQLAKVAALELGKPLSQFQLQQARRRILEDYGNEGFAFAHVEVDLELSEDHTLGRARFVISEREPVRIRGFVVRGNERTSEGVILSRLDLEQGGLYQNDLVRQSEEQVATLGVFSSVGIALEDPEVPAREKTVVVTVQELAPQYVDVRPGISTGEGARILLEYGHRNVMGRAVQARARAQLSYLPDFFIFEDQVRRNFNALSTADRLERRNTLTFEFPIAKKYRLALEGVDVRDNSRDFGITKRAGIVTLTHRTTRTITLVGGSSFELNDARIFGETETLRSYLEANPQQARLLNVPEGRSFAVALRATARWDNRDNPLGATRGMFVSAEAEPVVAYLDDDSAAIQLDQCAEAGNDPRTCEFKSQFIKLSQRTAGYIPFNDRGLSLALSLHVGAILQLVENSSTYPDRLFFLGGGDSLRGFLQASMIPEDIGEQLVAEDPNAGNDDERLTARKIVIRGGDFLINPRVELRIPLTKIFQTAIFLDSGNLWRDVDNVEPWVLRYSAGSGLRAVTPIGPLAFDYGIKLDRRFYEEDLGAFHFSIGLF